jgi:hypothetical protein
MPKTSWSELRQELQRPRDGFGVSQAAALAARFDRIAPLQLPVLQETTFNAELVARIKSTITRLIDQTLLEAAHDQEVRVRVAVCPTGANSAIVATNLTFDDATVQRDFECRLDPVAGIVDIHPVGSSRLTAREDRVERFSDSDLDSNNIGAPPPKTGDDDLVKLGYITAIVVPIVGFVLGIVVVTRQSPAARHGVRIIVTSLIGSTAIAHPGPASGNQRGNT